MNNLAPVEPASTPPVTIRRHRVDWEADDLDEFTARRALTRHQKLQQGCWFLNPRFTVSCPAPTPEFFRRVLELRSSWLRTCRQIQGTYGQKHEARKLQRQGQRAAFVELHMAKPDGERARNRSEVIPWQTLTEAERQEVLQRGRLAKQLGFSGILFIDGDLIPPRTWQNLADEVIALSGPKPIRLGSSAITPHPVGPHEP